jgi:hypothetical protein
LWVTGLPQAVRPWALGPQQMVHGQYAVTSIRITRLGMAALASSIRMSPSDHPSSSSASRNARP